MPARCCKSDTASQNVAALALWPPQPQISKFRVHQNFPRIGTFISRRLCQSEMLNRRDITRTRLQNQPATTPCYDAMLTGKNALGVNNPSIREAKINMFISCTQQLKSMHIVSTVQHQSTSPSMMRNTSRIACDRLIPR